MCECLAWSGGRRRRPSSGEHSTRAGRVLATTTCHWLTGPLIPGPTRPELTGSLAHWLTLAELLYNQADSS